MILIIEIIGAIFLIILNILAWQDKKRWEKIEKEMKEVMNNE